MIGAASSPRWTGLEEVVITAYLRQVWCRGVRSDRQFVGVHFVPGHTSAASNEDPFWPLFQLGEAVQTEFIDPLGRKLNLVIRFKSSDFHRRFSRTRTDRAEAITKSDSTRCPSLSR